jgi:hypothetical protein
MVSAQARFDPVVAGPSLSPGGQAPTKDVDHPFNRGRVSLIGEYRKGRLWQYVDGQPLTPVPLRINIHTLSGWAFLLILIPIIGWIILFILAVHKGGHVVSLNEGDEIEIEGEWMRGQFVKVKRLYNKSTEVQYGPRPHGKVCLRGEFRSGRLERYVDGRRRSPTPLKIRGRKFKEISLNEGDELEIEGRWKRGRYVDVKRLHNMTTKLEYR